MYYSQKIEKLQIYGRVLHLGNFLYFGTSLQYDHCFSKLDIIQQFHVYFNLNHYKL